MPVTITREMLRKLAPRARADYVAALTSPEGAAAETQAQTMLAALA